MHVTSLAPIGNLGPVEKEYFSQVDESKIKEEGEAIQLNESQSSIEVFDLNEFITNKKAFVQKVYNACRNVGFFALVNTGIDPDVLRRSYAASEEFFEASEELQHQIYNSEVNGQRGLVYSETAQGEVKKDAKRFIHIAKEGSKPDNIWPEWMDLKTPMLDLMKSLDKIGDVLYRTIALSIDEEEEFLVEQAKEGDNLLRPIFYPVNPDKETIGAAPHTDICDFTILPMSTADGLQILHNKKWIPVKVPVDAVVVNIGDKLQSLTNGLFKSAWHRVKVDPTQKRRSIVEFFHPRWNDSRTPTAKCIAKTEDRIQRYPSATSGELLMARLRELKLANPDMLKALQASGYLDRVAEIVKTGHAARPVQRTHILYQKSLEATQSN